MDARCIPHVWVVGLAFLSVAAEAVPVAVDAGRCRCELPAGQPYLMVVGASSAAPGPHRVTIRTEPGTGAAYLPSQTRSSPVEWHERTQAMHARLEAARRTHGTESDYRPTERPELEKPFSLFVKGKDFADPTNYVSVTGSLAAVGRHCQVYVDRDHADRDGLLSTVADVVRTFDEEVYPRSRRWIGRALDVDRDGRFTILFTGVLGKLLDGSVAVSGFVRGSDFYRDLSGPYGNRCDMMYLNTDLKPGPQLRTILAHEYTHAVVFSEHVFGRYLPDTAPRDEEGWLNEGLAHLAESRFGYGWGNLDYRVSTFLNAPERYRLVVEDYYAAGLWRSHGNRGATFLFLRWCQERHGATFLEAMARSGLSGTANLEAAMRQPFADLFRQWTVALGRSAFFPDVGTNGLCLQGPLGARYLCGPRFTELSSVGEARTMQIAGTSAAFFRLEAGSRLTVEAGEGAGLQVTLVPLAAARARLQLRHQSVDANTGTVRLVLSATGGDVELEGAAGEVLIAAGDQPTDTTYRPGEETSDCQTWFGPRRLRSGEQRVSPIIPGPAGRVFKVNSKDGMGRPVTAWTVVGKETEMNAK